MYLRWIQKFLYGNILSLGTLPGLNSSLDHVVKPFQTKYYVLMAYKHVVIR